HSATPADGFRGVERPAAREDGEAAEEGALLGGEQVPAPVEGGGQRLMAWEEGAAALPQQAEPTAQAVSDLLNRHGSHAGRSQLDGQRDTSEAPADLHDGRG